MPLPNDAAYTTLRTDIETTHAAEFAAAVAARDDQVIADAYNLDASPDFWVFRVIPVAEYRGAAGIVWTEVDALTVGKARIFEWLSGGLTLPLDTRDANVVQGLRDAFAAGTTTRTNLIAMARRRARRIEQLLATGTGSTGSPGTMTFEGRVTFQDVAKAFGRA